jgi:hypothetical protein
VYELRAKAFCRGYALSCFLDEPPWELMPRWAHVDIPSPVPDRELVVNSTFRYEPEGGPPAELLAPLHGLLRGFPLAWIANAGTGIWTPFWGRGEWIEVLQALHPGRPAPPDLSPLMRHMLATARILVPPGYVEEEQAAWEAMCRETAALFRAHGYAIVRGLVHPLHVAAMRRHYRALLASGRLPTGDSQVKDRQRLHSEPVGMFFHVQMVDLVGRIVGEAVKPAYVFFASYPPGSTLPRHVDRIECEFSISFLVDYIPEPDGPCGWPLFLAHPDIPEGVAAADLRIGDAVFYRGRELAHYRDRLPERHRSSSLFFHYLRSDYPGNTV